MLLDNSQWYLYCRTNIDNIQWACRITYCSLNIFNYRYIDTSFLYGLLLEQGERETTIEIDKIVSLTVTFYVLNYSRVVTIRKSVCLNDVIYNKKNLFNVL